MNLESSPSQRMAGFGNVDSGPIEPSWFVRYLERVAEVPGIKKYQQKALELLDPRSKENILDVGCGLGLGLRAIYDCNPTVGNLVGVDNSRTMIAQAVSLIPKHLPDAGIFTYIQGDAHKLPFEDGAFDASYAHRTFQHLANPDLAFREMKRVTKIGGRMIVADTDWHTLQLKGVSSEIGEKIKSVYLNIIANPRMGGMLQELFTEYSLTGLEVSQESIELLDCQTFKEVLALEQSLDLARNNGKISESDMMQCLGEVNRAQESIRASLAIYIAKGVKSS